SGETVSPILMAYWSGKEVGGDTDGTRDEVAAAPCDGTKSTPTDPAASAGIPEIPTSRMQSSSSGSVRTPTARQMNSALDRSVVESEATETYFSGKFKSVNFAVLSPGQ